MTRTKGKRRANAGDRVDFPEHHDDWRQSRWRSELRRKLLGWFSKNARQMPWRSDPTPYHVWVSEVMLQQTQVATVLPYYRRWMESFPSIDKLAAADESDLLRHWEGLGYYRRVRSIHAAAKQIIQDHDGKFPLTYDDALALPGVGRYTAGAVLSISTDAKLPVLEGNTQRVYSRWIAMRGSPTDTAANKLLWKFAEKILPPTGSGQLNQAAMELGALVCTPSNPNCDVCPVRSNCHANELGLQSQIPGKIKRIQYVDRTEFALLVTRKRRGETLYLARPLPDGGRWGGLWDFPRPTEIQTKTIDGATDWLSGQLGRTVNSGVRLMTIRHAVTKYRISLHVHRAAISGKGLVGAKPNPESGWQWVSLDALQSLPMSVTGRKIVKFLDQNVQEILPLD